MAELAEQVAGPIVGVDEQLEREFEVRLTESATLAFRVAYGVLRNRADAEDVAQDAFAKAYRRFAQLRDRERFRAWLVRITWRLALDRQRADRRRAVRETAHAREQPPSAVPAPVEDDRNERLWRAVDALPDKLRVAIVLANVEGHDIGEVARLLGLPAGTVKSRLYLARQRLKEQLL
jgi:RNA polymerase sigma-70 factor, ECF subfamily